jgi:hypothetical protein
LNGAEKISAPSAFFSGFSGFQPGEMLQQQPVNEDVAATDFEPLNVAETADKSQRRQRSSVVSAVPNPAKCSNNNR